MVALQDVVYVAIRRRLAFDAGPNAVGRHRYINRVLIIEIHEGVKVISETSWRIFILGVYLSKLTGKTTNIAYAIDQWRIDAMIQTLSVGNWILENFEILVPVHIDRHCKICLSWRTATEYPSWAIILIRFFHCAAVLFINTTSPRMLALYMTHTRQCFVWCKGDIEIIILKVAKVRISLFIYLRLRTHFVWKNSNTRDKPLLLCNVRVREGLFTFTIYVWCLGLLGGSHWFLNVVAGALSEKPFLNVFVIHFHFFIAKFAIRVKYP